MLYARSGYKNVYVSMMNFCAMEFIKSLSDVMCTRTCTGTSILFYNIFRGDNWFLNQGFINWTMESKLGVLKEIDSMNGIHANLFQKLFLISLKWCKGFVTHNVLLNIIWKRVVLVIKPTSVTHCQNT